MRALDGTSGRSFRAGHYMQLFVQKTGPPVEYARWSPQYERIRAEFGFRWEEERRAAARLRELLPAEARARPLERVGKRLRGRTAVVVGLAPGAGAPPLWQLDGVEEPPALLAADGAAERCLSAGLVPDVLVTDLDGPVASEVTANARGALAVVHAHGDNLPALDRWVPEFRGELAGSWAGPPEEALIDVGGFTDGDRAAYLAEHLGSRRILLWGFDLDRPDPELAKDVERKRAKLRWAESLLTELARASSTPVAWWGRDGAIRPLPHRTGPATQ